MLLNDPCCMRVGGSLEGLGIENGDTSTHKRGSALFVIATFPTGIMYEVNFKKLDSAN